MDDLTKTALRAAEAATAVHHRHAGRVDVGAAAEKGYSDFVSRVDLDAQVAALRAIHDRFPDHPILAEEEDARVVDGVAPERIVTDPAAAAELSGPLWVVDPLDGTTNFLNGHPMYSASVGVFVDGEPAAGAVVCGPTGERWWARLGNGAYRSGRRIRVSELARLSAALVGTGFPFKVLEMLPAYQEQFGRVLRATAGIRRGGSAALDLCHLAQGTFDAFWELYLKPWDVAAGIVIVREAGGVVERLDGTEIDLAEGSVVGASSPALLDDLRRVLEGGDADAGSGGR